MLCGRATNRTTTSAATVGVYIMPRAISWNQGFARPSPDNQSGSATSHASPMARPVKTATASHGTRFGRTGDNSRLRRRCRSAGVSGCSVRATRPAAPMSEGAAASAPVGACPGDSSGAQAVCSRAASSVRPMMIPRSRPLDPPRYGPVTAGASVTRGILGAGFRPRAGGSRTTPAAGVPRARPCCARAPRPHHRSARGPAWRRGVRAGRDPAR
ncbi:hypothetical protein ABMA10_08165 [Plantibacter sp. RU18]